MQTAFLAAQQVGSLRCCLATQPCTHSPPRRQVGNVATDHHAVELHVKSVLDTVDNLAVEEGPHAECLTGEQENSCTEMSDARGTTQQGEQVGCDGREGCWGR